MCIFYIPTMLYLGDQFCLFLDWRSFIWSLWYFCKKMYCFNSLHGKFFFSKTIRSHASFEHRIDAKPNLTSFVFVLKSGIPDLWFPKKLNWKDWKQKKLWQFIWKLVGIFQSRFHRVVPCKELKENVITQFWILTWHWFWGDGSHTGKSNRKRIMNHYKLPFKL